MAKSLPKVKITTNLDELIDLLQAAKRILKQVDGFQLELKAEIIEGGD